MSVELRITTHGECDHGPKYWWEPRSECAHHVECDWGRIEHPQARPDRGEVGPLMLVSRDYFGKLFKKGQLRRIGGFHSVDAVPAEEPVTDETELRLFFYVDHDGRRWTWELFEAHWADGNPRPRVYVGRWPD